MVKAQHDADISLAAGTVALPEALGRKYPNAPREWIWQWVFPATRTIQELLGHRDITTTIISTPTS